LQVPNRGKTPSRNQFVLDFSREEIVDNVYDQMVKILDKVDVDYIKWDMNRNMTEIYSAAYPAAQQGEISHRYILGLYNLMNRLTTRYPEILFEGCSGGGGRFDCGILYYMPQSWTSDNTDAFARLKIQYGTSLAFPISSMTAHVSAAPNHQTGRSTSLKMRGDVAMAGVFGYELNLTEMTDDEKVTVTEQIKFYKAHRQLLQYGDFTRLKSPYEGNFTAWQFTSEDKNDVMLFRYAGLAEAQPEFTTTQLANLDPEKKYEDVATGDVFGGDELMNIGLYDTLQKGDFTSEVTVFKAIAPCTRI
jgi:alpha-galactosidase